MDLGVPQWWEVSHNTEVGASQCCITEAVIQVSWVVLKPEYQFQQKPQRYPCGRTCVLRLRFMRRPTPFLRTPCRRQMLVFCFLFFKEIASLKLPLWFQQSLEKHEKLRLTNRGEADPAGNKEHSFKRNLNLLSHILQWSIHRDIHLKKKFKLFAYFWRASWEASILISSERQSQIRLSKTKSNWRTQISASMHIAKTVFPPAPLSHTHMHLLSFFIHSCKISPFLNCNP